MSHHVQASGVPKASIVEQIRAREWQGMLLCSPEHVYYTSGLPAVQGSGNPILFALNNQLPSFVYIGANGRLTLLCWIGATLGFTFDADEVRTFFSRESAIDELQDFLQATLQLGDRVAIEQSCPFYVYAALQNSIDPSHIVAEADEVMIPLRLVKTEREIALIRQATRIVEDSVADLRGQIQVGMSRLELINAAKRRMLAHGATGIGHTTIAFGTSNPEIAFDETLEAHKVVTLDLGAIVDGYASDNRRLLHSGPIPDDLRALHQTMCSIVEQVGQALQPGAAFADIYTLATQLYEDRGLPPYFISAGHSIGLRTEEAEISPDSALGVQAGMVLNIELYTPYSGGSYIGDEETFLVTEDGSIRLTQSDPAVDLVDITVPHQLHYAIALAALQQGKHVLVEKPMAMKAEQASHLIDTARSMGVKFTVAENTHFVETYREAERMLQSQALGDIRFVRTYIAGTEAVRIKNAASWVGSPENSGVLLDSGVHSFYLLRWLFGGVRSIQAFASRIIPESQVDDNTLAFGHLANGTVFESVLSCVVEAPWTERLEIHGGKGSLVIDQLTNPPVMHFQGPDDVEGTPVARVPYEPLAWKYLSIVAEVQDFARTIIEDRPPLIDPLYGYHAVLVAEAAYQSIATGKSVAIEEQT